ncbi:MAG TPA: hypothetical protein VKV35_12775 [Streptosporangiaceae bacterium]|nr:hypothetical protein [Streptosporangiaceae bacterium]
MNDTGSPGTVTAAGSATPAAGPLRAACELARMTNCGYCWARPQQPCTAGPGGAAGYHLARFARAARRGLITPAGFDAALAAAGDGMYSGAAVVFDVPGARAEDHARGAS